MSNHFLGRLIVSCCLGVFEAMNERLDERNHEKARRSGQRPAEVNRREQRYAIANAPEPRNATATTIAWSETRENEAERVNTGDISRTELYHAKLHMHRDNINHLIEKIFTIRNAQSQFASWSADRKKIWLNANGFNI